jgi:KDO2-lipid IV(A) lauroyltransferase
MSTPFPTRAGAAPVHAPEPSWARRVLGDFHVTGLVWYRAHRWIVRVLPDWLAGPAISIATSVCFLTLVRIRRAIASNLVPVLGPSGWFERQRRIYRTLHAFGSCLTERYQRLVTDRPFEVEVESMEHWRAVAESGRGFVAITAHLGLYEVGSMVPAMKEARRVHLVREPEVDLRAQAFIRATVAAVEGANYTMHFQDGDPSLGMALVEALGRGEIVAIQGDRPRTGSRTVDATIFGRPFPLPAGPAALARTAEVPILPVFAIREGRRRFRLVFRPPIDVPRTRDRNADLAQAMQRIAREIEGAIRRTPHQWFVFRELWPDQAGSSVR